MDIREAIQKVLSDCPNKQAKRYARAASGTKNKYELYIQIRYISYNTTYWRKRGAKEVKEVIKEYLK